MSLDNEKLIQLPFIDYLKWMSDRLDSISYSKETNNAYYEAREIVDNVIKRYIKEYNFTNDNYHDNEIGNMLRINKVELDDFYKYDKTNKERSQTISQFKSDMKDDIGRLINEIEK